MGRKRSSPGEEETVVQIVSDDDEDANADLSMGIVAKASQRGPTLSALIILSDDDDDRPYAHSPIPSSPSMLPELTPEHTAFEQLSPEQFSSTTLPSKQIHTRKKQKNRKKKKKSTKATEGNQAQSGNVEGDVLFKVIADDGEDNLEMRKLLRGPRYFDPPEQGMETCFRCGNTGHLAAQCLGEARKKACYVCGGFDHEVKDCPQVPRSSSGICFTCGRDSVQA